MKLERRLYLFGLAAALSLSSAQAATDGEVAARKVALDVAGAFSNDGFKLRDGNWCGALQAGKPQLVQVNLYAGNQYWFTLGATPTAKKVAVTIYDESGKLLASEPFQEAATAAAGFAPEASGSYYVKVALIEGGPSEFCLIYSYK